MAIHLPNSSLHSQILELVRAARLLVKEEAPFYASEQDWTALHLIETPVQQELKPESNRILQPRVPLEEPPPPPPGPKIISKPAEPVIPNMIQKPVYDALPSPRSTGEVGAKAGHREDMANERGCKDEASECVINELLNHVPYTPPPPSAKPSTPSPQNSFEFEAFRKLFATIAPQLPLIAQIPSDKRAKAIAERWKTKNQAAPYSVLSFNEPKEHQSILRNLSAALDSAFGGGRFIEAAGIEKEGRWESFLSAQEVKLIIVCDYALWQQPGLMKFYRELQSRGERFLLNTPLFLLPDLSLYLKDPLLKRSLWKALCRMTERGR